MRASLRLVAALIAAGAASPSLAARTLCSGEAEGASGAKVDVEISFDGSRETERWARWTPAATDEAEAAPPWLIIGYPLAGTSLGQPTTVQVLAIVTYDKPVRSRHAEIVVRSGGGFWRRQWRTFEDNFASPQADARVPEGSKPEAFLGMAPIAFAGPGGNSFNLELLAAVEKAADAQVSVEGDAGESFGRHDFSLADHATRDRLLAQAIAKATSAAAKPAACPQDRSG